MRLRFLIFSFVLVFTFFTLLATVSKENTTIVFNEKYIIEYLIPVPIEFWVCGVKFVPPWFEVKDSQGRRILLVDSNGNLYIGSSKVYQETYVGTGWKNAFIIIGFGGPYFAFNSSLAKIKGKIIENASPLSTDSFIIINRSNNAILASFHGKTGYIIIRGKAVYNGAQAGCPYGYICDIETGDCVPS